MMPLIRERLTRLMMVCPGGCVAKLLARNRSDEHPRLTRDFLRQRWPVAQFDIGDHSYGHPDVQEAMSGKLVIGKFC